MTQRWWDESLEIQKAVVTAFQAIESRQETRRINDAIHLGMYERRTITSLDGADWAYNALNEYEDPRENVPKSVVDSAVAKIGSKRPRMIQMTNGAEWELQNKARKRTLMIEGVIHEQKGYKKGRAVFKDAGIFDNGHMAVYADPMRKKVMFERVLDNEIRVDDLDGKYGNPRSLFRHKIISRAELQAAYPGKTHAYNIAHAGLIVGGTDPESIDDPVSILEAFHLPSGPDAKDGRHVICTDQGCLVDGTWARERFPLATFRWKDRPLGWRGMGIIEDVEDLYRQLTELDDKIEAILDGCTNRVFIEKNSQIDVEDLSNDTDGKAICRYIGKPPVFSNDPGPSQELFMERERIKRAIFEHLGLSQMFSESKKPAGLTAGVAIREAKDIESERFTDVYQAWDEFWLDVGELTLDALEDLVEMVPAKEVIVNVPTGGTLESIQLSDVDMERSKYQMQIRPASMLPKEPAGRLSTLHEMAGMFPDAATYLYGKMSSPDVDDVMSLLSAGGDAIRYDIEKLNEGEYITPEPFLELGAAMKMALAGYMKARNGGASEKVQEAFRNYLLGLKNLMEEQKLAEMAAQAGQMPQQMPGTGPMGQLLPPGGGMGMPPQQM